MLASLRMNVGHHAHNLPSVYFKAFIVISTLNPVSFSSYFSCEDLHNECPGADRHRSQTGWQDTFPETPDTLDSPGLRKAVLHT